FLPQIETYNSITTNKPQFQSRGYGPIKRATRLSQGKGTNYKCSILSLKQGKHCWNQILLQTLLFKTAISYQKTGSNQ
ncbi:hypothetical protein ACJMK2_029961, partial [Sinanodonta woodiana]